MVELNRILIVEDSIDHAKILIRELKKDDDELSIIHLTDGQKAINYVNEERENSDSLPKLIILDLKLPKYNGHEVLEVIRSSNAFKYIPVVILSTSGAPNDQIKAYNLHANSYLIKPIEYKKFKEMVSSIKSYWIRWNDYPRET